MLKKKIMIPVIAFAVTLACAGAICTETREMPITMGGGHIDLEIF